MDLDVLLCDHAQVAGEKLFISGANIDRVVFPTEAVAPYQVTFAAAGVIHIPWTETNAEHVLSFSFVTEDGAIPEMPAGFPVGDQGIGGDMRFNVGRPPMLSDGEEQLVPFAFNFQGLPLMRAGRYALNFAFDGDPIRRVPLAVVVAATTSFGRASSPIL